VPFPDGLRDDDVDQAGLILDRDEGDAAGAGWSLPVGDDAADEHPGAVVERGELRGWDDTELVEAATDERGGVVVSGDPGSPQVSDELLGFGHRRQRRQSRVRGGVELSGPVAGRRPGGPQRVATGEAEAVEGAGGGERFDLIGGEADAAGEVGDRGVRAVGVALAGDSGGQRLADGAHAGQPEAHGRLLGPGHGVAARLRPLEDRAGA
jgi:hypothetical protein